MTNLEEIIKLLFKKVASGTVIREFLRYDRFSEQEFMQMATAYIPYYSNNEASNMLMYYQGMLDRENFSLNRVPSIQDRGLNVFDVLFYYANQVLIFQDNDVVCRYDKMLEWRKVTLEISEELLVCAYMAQMKTSSEMKVRGFGWKRVISHNNTQLKEIVRRKISENHFHLGGSAPIFQISWISMMNDVNNSKAIKYLKGYDQNRLYTNIDYSVTYVKDTIGGQHMQAVLIRLLLFTVLTKKRIRLGNYCIDIKELKDYVILPPITINRAGDCIKISGEKLKKYCNLDNCNKENPASFMMDFLAQHCEIQDLKERVSRADIFAFNSVFFEFIRNVFSLEMLIRCIDEIEVDEMSATEFVRKVLAAHERADLELFQYTMDYAVFYDIWQERTIKNIKYLIKNPELIEDYRSEIQSVIDCFRYADMRNKPLADYAFGGIKERKGVSNANTQIFEGERWLLFQMLSKIYNNADDSKGLSNLFYAYVLIKEKIRSELVQSNKNVGFVNFQKYNNRKSELIKDRIYKDEMVRLAVREGLITENINYMEIRISPCKTARETKEWITSLDHIISSKEDNHNNSFFYVIHFIKSSDTMKGQDNSLQFRHYKRRKLLEKQAGELIRFREEYPLYAQRVKGIDAASNEVGCRPEVFAYIFRKLKAHIKQIDDGIDKQDIPQLRATFHVGEDFLDVVDGLRAIDEAISFLNLESGDRMGHALVLGIDAEKWYASKNHRIILSQQDYLDNIVWLYHRIIRFGIENMEILKDFILKEFSYYFKVIYENHMSRVFIDEVCKEMQNTYRLKYGISFEKSKQYSFDINTYYEAWKLRGDHPEFYIKGYFDQDLSRDDGRGQMINRKIPKVFDKRYIPEVSILYFFYQYDRCVKREGSRVIEKVISPCYIRGVTAVQRKMQKVVAKHGIGIETNPSSNFLIGTFRKYDEHPIITFYNKGLVNDIEKLNACEQLNVSINTDDQGVFSTSLENEYALMACALEKVKDQDGNFVYNRSMIYEWLDQIREMGNQQSFGEKELGAGK